VLASQATPPIHNRGRLDDSTVLASFENLFVEAHFCIYKLTKLGLQRKLHPMTVRPVCGEGCTRMACAVVQGLPTPESLWLLQKLYVESVSQAYLTYCVTNEQAAEAS
jgi:hypothetical protein